MRGGRWIGAGYLAWLTDRPTLACLVHSGQPGAAAYWNRPYGITMTLVRRRYLRYMLIQTDEERDGREAA